MRKQLRATRTTRAVLTALIDGYEDDLWGFRICSITGLPSGTVYPILSNLEDLGWVETRWDESPASGPRRRFYQLTPSGMQLAKRATSSTAASQLIPLRGEA